MNISRTPEIMADAAYEIFTKDSSTFTGNFCIDDLILYDAGIRDFSKYADVPFAELANSANGTSAYLEKSLIPASYKIRSSIQKLPVKVEESLVKISYAASAIISGVLEIFINSSPPKTFLTAAVAIAVLGQGLQLQLLLLKMFWAGKN